MNGKYRSAFDQRGQHVVKQYNINGNYYDFEDRGDIEDREKLAQDLDRIITEIQNRKDLNGDLHTLAISRLEKIADEISKSNPNSNVIGEIGRWFKEKGGWLWDRTRIVLKNPIVANLISEAVKQQIGI